MNNVFDLMYHSGLSYDMLVNIDIETFNSFIKRINEQNTGVSELTEAQKDMVKEARGKIYDG